MELNGALSNPFTTDKILLLKVSKLYHTALARVGISPKPPTTTPRSHVRAVRRALVEVLAEAGSDLRLFELQRRVEERLDRELPRTRFKDYVNDQSKGRSPLLERLGYGRYRLRTPEGTYYPRVGPLQGFHELPQASSGDWVRQWVEQRLPVERAA